MASACRYDSGRAALGVLALNRGGAAHGHGAPHLFNKILHGR
jgi:hypothetical protein